jgi:hypothetical protein
MPLRLKLVALKYSLDRHGARRMNAKGRMRHFIGPKYGGAPFRLHRPRLLPVATFFEADGAR